jgi:Mlc titration factor MtfA (ptsG expression regulator)
MPQDSLTVDLMDTAQAYVPVENSYREDQVISPRSEIREDPYMPGPGIVITFLAVVALIIYKVLREGHAAEIEQKQRLQRGAYSAADPVTPLKYAGEDLGFSAAVYEEVLAKHCHFYQRLNGTSQAVFTKRVMEFTSEKTFLIHDEAGFKEMPILVSAASIQLSFGMDNYLLPHFRYIHIYPEEFLRLHPQLCFLEGNVSGNSIRLSWKHFLKGIQNGEDGQHVGLHEMAHALYYQAFVCEDNIDCNFRDFFENFNADGNKVYATEQDNLGGLYSDYAIKNFQEFWAESVEIFFEKPVVLRTSYPALYDCLKTLLNQDPSSYPQLT